MNKGGIKSLLSNLSSIKPINVFSIDNHYKRSYYELQQNTSAVNQHPQQATQTKGKGKESGNVKCLLTQLKQEMGDKSINEQRDEAKRIFFTRNVKGRNKEDLASMSRQKYISTEPVNLLGNTEDKPKALRIDKHQRIIPERCALLEKKTLSNKELQSRGRIKLNEDIESKNKPQFKASITTISYESNDNINKKIAEMTSKLLSERTSHKGYSDIISDNPSRHSNQDLFNKHSPNIIDDYRRDKRDYLSLNAKTKEPSSLSEQISLRNDDNTISIINNINCKPLSVKASAMAKEENNKLKKGNNSLLVSMNEQIIQMGLNRDKLEKELKQREQVIAKLKGDMNDLKIQKDKELMAALQKIRAQDEAIHKMSKHKEQTDEFVKKLLSVINSKTGDKDKQLIESTRDAIHQLVKDYLNSNQPST